MLSLNPYPQYMIQCVQVVPIDQEEVKKEQVEVKVEEQTSPAATTDVNQLDQKVMQT